MIPTSKAGLRSALTLLGELFDPCARLPAFSAAHLLSPYHREPRGSGDPRPGRVVRGASAVYGEECPVHLRMVERGGNLDELRSFFNVDRHGWTLIRDIWSLRCGPGFALPIRIAKGELGAACSVR